MTSYRSLTQTEMQQLVAQGCSSDNWGSIQVSQDFAVSNVSNVNFYGKTYIGSNVVLKNIYSLSSSGKTTFANGLEVGVLKEDGGLEVIIYDNLTSMEAAFEVQEASREPELVALMQDKAKAYAQSIESDGNIIEDGAVIANVGTLADVHVGPAAHISGASRLKNVSINSLPEAPSGVGDGVILENVIVSSDSHITDFAQMDNCFVGQGCHIGRMYSATQSLFFANCHFENGEACAYFAGPYSVSHHKATLMIACQTSFFNAGSGSNQSNHSYKMGPNKYGQLLRGAKLGSSSYVYWPMQIGAFSTVIMHHTGHQDLRDLPFSLITETPQGTMIVPGQAFRSVGTRRDALKWPKRDKRTEGTRTRRDLLNFSMLNPFTVQYILKGIDILKEMQASGATEYKGCKISQKHIAQGVQLYQQAIDMYLGQILSQNLTGAGSENVDEWQDYGGMLVPRVVLLDALRQGKSFEDVQSAVPSCEYDWVSAHFDIKDSAALISKGLEAEKAWNAALDADGEQDIKNCCIEM